MLNRRQFLVEVSAAAALAKVAAAQAQRAPQFPQEPVTLSKIKHVDIVHHTHTDVGYTALPSVVRDNQRRFIDAAIDACQNDKTFRWTVEVLLELDDWWKTAPPERHAAFLALVKAGQIDVMAMPFNQTSFLNAMQWRQMMSWIPETLWSSLDVQAAMQNDVNGIPRAGVMKMLDRGVKYLMMGLNNDHGGPPFRRPSAFWWKMPDGRRIFVWLGDVYGQSQRVYLGRQSPLLNDEQTVRAAHANTLERLETLESEGYGYDRLLITHTNPTMDDNGSPFPSLAPFINTWNKLGLKPPLRLVTATVALSDMQKAIGDGIPTMEGEWTDWWANGDASSPHEVAASRVAKRYIAAAMSPVFGPMPERAQPAVENILKDLCLFDEHTWGASFSVSQPYDLRTLGQFTEKSELAYRPMGAADALLTRRVRTIIDPMPEGVYVVNPAPAGISGWASLTLGRGQSLGGRQGQPQQIRTLVDTKTGEKIDLQGMRFWLEEMQPNSVRSFRPETAASSEPRPSTAAAASSAAKPDVKLDDSGWPQSVSWPGMRKPLFDGTLGHFLCVGTASPAERRTIGQLHAEPDAAKREAARKTTFKETAATYGKADLQETPHTLTYVQEICHERLAQARRTLELWKREPRARITVRFDRLSSLAPEVLFLDFTLPDGVPLPLFSSGGVPFTPYRDQLPGTCRDYFGIDGWAHYATGDGHWLWVTRDAPLVAIGSPHVVERHQAEPADHRRILAMVFDNCWQTNFVADQHGVMEFQFDLVWRERINAPADLAEALATQPIAIVNPATHEDPALIKNVFRP